MKKDTYFKDLSRKDYIVKANEIIRMEGEEALTIRRIARELHCSSASLYRYFENIEELLFYAEIPFLNVYLQEIQEKEKNWKDAWDIHFGIWDCYTSAAFTFPWAFNKIFLSPLAVRTAGVLYHVSGVHQSHQPLYQENAEDAGLSETGFFDVPALRRGWYLYGGKCQALK